MATRNLIWCGAVVDPSGYGEATRNYLLALQGQGAWDLRLRPRSFFQGDVVPLTGRFAALRQIPTGPFPAGTPHMLVQHLTPENWRIDPEARGHIGVTCFETDAIPDPWQMQMRAMDAIWTFSRWGADTVEAAGINRPVHVVPHGVDVAKFRPGAPPLALHTRLEGVFRFGANFDWTARKNPEALLRAYFTAFGPGDEVALVLKVYHQGDLERSRQLTRARVEAVRRQLGLTSTPPVFVIADILSAEQMPSFYGSIDAYVLPSCGEGWSLTLTEAMASGLPTIATAWSAPTEYMTPENSVPVTDFRLEAVRPDEAPSPLYAGHRWAKIDADALGQAMRGVYDDAGHREALGARARQDMVERFTWDRAAQVVHDLLALHD